MGVLNAPSNPGQKPLAKPIDVGSSVIAAGTLGKEERGKEYEQGLRRTDRPDRRRVGTHR